METGKQPLPVPSYAAILTGKSQGDSKDAGTQGNIEEEIDLSDDDIITETRYGLPAIQLSYRVYKLMESSMARMVILKLLERNIDLNALNNKTYALWHPSQSFNLTDLEIGYFHARFQNDDDYTKVLAEGSWIIYGQYLTVKPWNMEFHTSQSYPTTIVTWIRFSGLPKYLYSKKFPSSIGNLVRKVAKLDFHKRTNNRRKFAGVVVYIDLTRPKISKVVVGNKIQTVEYENLPLICFVCEDSDI
ncbi:uncharacterized protein LOC120135376 [Hibiscus syriacus]|uniref:uncharacterized protein LOC120135376 n=1 Tax=Hibiscus syriacus TaxID=106335 RepID=UPI0019212042|nr:uncharacterized protein LOC120135376 [Hibiscus syriacus]